MRRVPIVLIAACLCVAPATAAAQSDPFTPITPATPAPTAPPVVTPVATSTPAAEQGDISRGLLLGVAGVIALSFLGIGVYVTRDARKSLTEADRRALDREREGEVVPLTPAQKAAARKAKAKAREKGKRQRQARKAGRKR